MDSPCFLETAAAALGGRRQTIHGATIADILASDHVNKCDRRTGVFAVFEGHCDVLEPHAGNLATKFCQDNLLDALQDSDEFYTDLELALAEAGQALNRGIRVACMNNLSSESTAASIIAVRDGHVYCLEAGTGRGRTRSLLSRPEGKLQWLHSSLTSNPSNNLGALGDEPPSISVVGLDYEDEFIIMATGEFWSTVDAETAARIVKAAFRRGDPTDRITQRLARNARANGAANVVIRLIRLSAVNDLGFDGSEDSSRLSRMKSGLVARRNSWLDESDGALFQPNRRFALPWISAKTDSDNTKVAEKLDSATEISTSSVSAPSTTAMTICVALWPKRNPKENYKRYHPYLAMTKRFLGEEPSFYPIMTLSTAAINTHVGLFARMFHAPGVDMRLPGFISPKLRRLAFLTASEAFSCDYCSAHAFCFGDMLKGPIRKQFQRGKGPVVVQDVSRNSVSSCEEPDEKAVVALASAGVRRPFYESADGPLLVDLGRDVRRLCGDRGIEIVKAVVSFAGALNTVTDILGVTLEEGSQSFTTELFRTASGDEWAIRPHHENVSEKAKERVEDEHGNVGGLSGELSNMGELMRTMPHAMKGMKFEMLVLYRGLPMSAKKQNEWVQSRLGEQGARFFLKMTGMELRRAFCFGLRENLMPDEHCVSGTYRQWAYADRLSFLYTFAWLAGSMELCDVAVELTSRYRNVTIEAAALHLEEFTTCQSSMLPPATAAARRLVVFVSQRTDNIPGDLVELVTGACAPEAVVELASLCSFIEMWRRLVVLFLLDDNV